MTIPLVRQCGVRLAIVVAFCGCGRIGFDAGATSSDGGNGDAAMGSGQISGHGCNNLVFSSLGAVYVVGNQEIGGLPEVLLFAESVSCAQLCAMSWDDNHLACQTQQGLAPVPNAMQFVRFTFGATGAGTYSAGMYAPRPDATQVSATAYITDTLNPTGTATQCYATGGTASLTTGGATGPLSGTFSFTIPGAMLMGTFDAAWCASGWYP